MDVYLYMSGGRTKGTARLHEAYPLGTCSARSIDQSQHRGKGVPYRTLEVGSPSNFSSPTSHFSNAATKC